MNTDTQCREIIRYLAKGKTLTMADSWRLFGHFSLPKRIYDLRNGKAADHVRWPISTDIITTRSGKRIASYRIDTKRKRS